MRFFSVVFLVLYGLASPLAAQDLLPRYEAAQTAFEARMLTLMGSNPAAAGWSAQRRAAAACALSTLEQSRGRATAETYVRAVEAGAARAAGMQSAGGFGALTAQIHAQAGLQLRRDIVPITQRCGIGL